jgi:AAA+ ATPase superfamily predicted ATPase
MFVGRVEELNKLEKEYNTNEARLCVIYGRRRVGKTELIRKFSLKKRSILLEGIEGQQTKIQIALVTKQLAKQIEDPLLEQIQFKTWIQFFDYITTFLGKSKKRTIVVLDEIQWMAAGQTKLISILKHYWDTHWIRMNVQFILCGSVASYVVKKVLRSKALYGRVHFEMLLTELKPNEAAKILNRRGTKEILTYLTLFGGIPRYLKQIDQSYSLAQNLDMQCFEKNGFFVEEVNRVFYSQFKEAQVYRRIIILLSKQNLSLKEISKKLKIPSGGGLKSYLENLEMSRFIKSYIPLNGKSAKQRKYKLFDEYLCFYFKYIKSNIGIINETEKGSLFSKVISRNWKPWLGNAFERFCVKNAIYLSEKMEFSDEVLKFGGLSGKGFQFDLVYYRDGNIITFCEVKYSENLIGTEVISEFEEKIENFKASSIFLKKDNITIERVLIAPFDVDNSLKKSKYFHKILTLESII